MTRNTDSTAVWNLKPERWGLALVQEKYQEERPVTRDNNNIILNINVCMEKALIFQ
jgi:hypothetical protein